MGEGRQRCPSGRATLDEGTEGGTQGASSHPSWDGSDGGGGGSPYTNRRYLCHRSLRACFLHHRDFDTGYCGGGATMGVGEVWYGPGRERLRLGV